MATDPIGAVIANVLRLQQLGTTLNGESEKLVRDLFDDVAAQIARLDPTAVQQQEAVRQARLEALVGDLTDLAGRTFEEIRRTLRERLLTVGLDQGAWAEAQLHRAVGSVAVDLTTGRVGREMLSAILDAKPFEGFVLRDWTEGQEALVVKRVRRQIQLGMAQGETLDDLIRRVRGRSDGRGGFTGGVLQTTTREAEALVRTAVNFIANQAHVATFAANADILAAVEVTAVLDDRTSEVCMANDGKRTDAADPDPKLIPPFHFNCRTVLVPVVDWEGLGIEPPVEGKRASQDGPVPADWTYEDWLREQDAAAQDEILGPGRAKLFRAGKIGLRDLIRNDRSIVPLEELAAL